MSGVDTEFQIMLYNQCKQLKLESYELIHTSCDVNQHRGHP